MLAALAEAARVREPEQEQEQVRELASEAALASELAWGVAAPQGLEVQRASVLASEQEPQRGSG